MNKQVIIREAVPKDAPETRELFLRLLKSYPEAYLPTWEDEKELGIDEEIKKLKEIQKRPTSKFFVAEVENELVGMVICHGHDKTRIRHQATIEKMGVLPEYRGQGIGRLLLNHLLNWVENKTKILRLDLWIILSNSKALPFYQKFGFEKENRIKRACLIEDKFYDSIIMVKWLRK